MKIKQQQNISSKFNPKKQSKLIPRELLVEIIKSSTYPIDVQCLLPRKHLEM